MPWSIRKKNSTLTQHAFLLLGLHMKENMQTRIVLIIINCCSSSYFHGLGSLGSFRCYTNCWNHLIPDLPKSHFPRGLCVNAVTSPLLLPLLIGARQHNQNWDWCAQERRDVRGTAMCRCRRLRRKPNAYSMETARSRSLLHTPKLCQNKICIQVVCVSRRQYFLCRHSNVG